jgi:hypothetical protein
MGARISGHVRARLMIRIAMIVVVVAVLIDAHVPVPLASYCRLIKTSHAWSARLRNLPTAAGVTGLASVVKGSELR